MARSHTNAPSAVASRGAETAPGSKVERIVKHAVYEIATGAWGTGQRLPSLREARDLWSVNHLTVLRAYRQLVRKGLVVNRPRAGFFVAAEKAVRHLGRDPSGLESLYDLVRRRLDRLGARSPLAAFRWLARRAESRARREPECAFAECTAFQAEGHAREIRDRLDVPCLALTTATLAGGRAAIPRHVRTLLTTSFHHQEVQRFARRHGFAFAAVPIEFSPRLARRLAAQARAITVLALDSETAAHVARTARTQIARAGLRVTSASATAEDVEARVRELTGGRRREATVVLSTSLWSAWTGLPEARRRGLPVLPFEYEIGAAGWPVGAEALGLPPGTLV